MICATKPTLLQLQGMLSDKLAKGLRSLAGCGSRFSLVRLGCSEISPEPAPFAACRADLGHLGSTIGPDSHDHRQAFELREITGLDHGLARLRAVYDLQLEVGLVDSGFQVARVVRRVVPV